MAPEGSGPEGRRRQGAAPPRSPTAASRLNPEPSVYLHGSGAAGMAQGWPRSCPQLSLCCED